MNRLLSADARSHPARRLVIQGTKDALPKNSLTLRGRHRMRITVLDEIPYEAFADLPPEEVADAVRQQIAERVESPPAVL